TGTRVTDLRPLTEDKYLKELSVGSAQIPGLSSLVSLENLVNLTVFDQNDVDLSPISGLHHLERLSIWGPHTFDLSFLHGLDRLKLLSISAFSFNTPLATAKKADTIGQLPKLSQLSLAGINIENIDFIRALHNLTELNLSQLPIR